jgi:hypothetical protein
MKKISFNKQVTMLRICIIAFVLAIASLFLFSFTARKLADDFLKQLGITKSTADEKIANNILGGYLDVYGVKNTKNIITGNRAAVAKDLLTYTKEYVNSTIFTKQYGALKETNKPKEYKVKTPEEMRKENIEVYKKAVADAEGYLKKADAGTKPIFEKVLVESKKYLKEAEDPNNKQIAGYAKGYPELAESYQQSYTMELQKWESQYPANHLLFIKMRLQQFLSETADIDFAAELTAKSGKKIFVNPVYERKSNRWKMAYRTGNEVVATARAFVTQWIAEIK